VAEGFRHGFLNYPRQFMVNTHLRVKCYVYQFDRFSNEAGPGDRMSQFRDAARTCEYQDDLTVSRARWHASR
jgi:hypothetical protein